MDTKIFRKFNDIAFSDQSEENTAPKTAPRSEGLLAVKTPRNVTTRNRQ